MLARLAIDPHWYKARVSLQALDIYFFLALFNWNACMRPELPLPHWTRTRPSTVPTSRCQDTASAVASLGHPKYRRHCDSQRESRDQQHRGAFRFCSLISRCEEHHHSGQREAAAHQRLACERTDNPKNVQ